MYLIGIKFDAGKAQTEFWKGLVLLLRLDPSPTFHSFVALVIISTHPSHVSYVTLGHNFSAVIRVRGRHGNLNLHPLHSDHGVFPLVTLTMMMVIAGTIMLSVGERGDSGENDDPSPQW